MRSMSLPSALEAPTMARLACARTMARTTTQPSWSTPTGIASRPIAAVRVPWRHTSATAHASVPHVRRVHWLGRWRVRIEVWLENHKARRELRRCASLDPRFARDIGFSSDELAVVCAAPPWKAVTRPPSSLERGPSVGVANLGNVGRRASAQGSARALTVRKR
jgi:hypothetical protein